MSTRTSTSTLPKPAPTPMQAELDAAKAALEAGKFDGLGLPLGGSAARERCLWTEAEDVALINFIATNYKYQKAFIHGGGNSLAPGNTKTHVLQVLWKDVANAVNPDNPCTPSSVRQHFLLLLGQMNKAKETLT